MVRLAPLIAGNVDGNLASGIVPEDKLEAFVASVVAEVARPRYLPTIIPPKKWTRVWGGGYYANIINDLPLVRVH